MSKEDYTLVISFVGYTSLITRIQVQDFASTDSITDTFHLVPDKVMLPLVQVSAVKNFMIVENDKKIFNVSMMPGAEGGTASDIIKQVPLVDVDKDGNVSLHGKTANVLIDGKQSPYTDIATALQVIPASGLDKIEVMTSPSAKYDAQGEGGVVNIVLKKDKATGFHGVLNLDAATVPDYHAGTDFNFRKNRFNVFGNINLHDRKLISNSSIQQSFFNTGVNNIINQQEIKSIYNKDIDSRIGLDYFINDKTTLTFTQALSDRNGFNNSTVAIDSGNYLHEFKTYQQGLISALSHLKNYNSNIDFTHKFKTEGEQLTANLMFADKISTTNTAINYTGRNVVFRNIRNSGNNNSKLYTIQLDFIKPLGKSGKLETGYKTNARDNQNGLNALLYDTTYNLFNYSPELSGQFTYREQVHALYATFANAIGKFNYKLGLRGELSNMNGNSYLHQAAFSKEFLNLFPGIFLSTELREGQTIGLN